MIHPDSGILLNAKNKWVSKAMERAVEETSKWKSQSGEESILYDSTICFSGKDITVDTIEGSLGEGRSRDRRWTKGL